MFGVLRWLFGIEQQAKLERLHYLAAKMDELLMAGKITPDLRQRLQAAREKLERQIRELLLVQSCRARV